MHGCGRTVEAPVVEWECTCYCTWVTVEHEEKLDRLVAACACRHKRHSQLIVPVAAGVVVVEQLERVAWTGLRLAVAAEHPGQVSVTMST